MSGTVSGAIMQPMSSNLSPESAQGGLDPLTSSSVIAPRRGCEDQGSLPTPLPRDTPANCSSTSAPFPRNFPTGHILAIPQLPFWAGLTSQVEKHQSHSFHVKSSRCGLSSLGGCRAWQQGLVSWGSQLLCLRTGLTACLSPPEAVGREPPFSLLPCPPQQRFGGGGLGEGRSLMLFDHMFSLSHREVGGLGLRYRYPLWSVSVWVLGPVLHASTH